MIQSVESSSIPDPLPAPTPAQSPSTIAYARPAAQYGVVVQSEADETRIIVPRVQGWRIWINQRTALLVLFGWVFISVAITEARQFPRIWFMAVIAVALVPMLRMSAPRDIQ